jgi:fluoride exporter
MPIGLAVAVAVAGAAGALARYLLDFCAGDHMEPHHQVYVTFAINVGGSLLLGLLVGMHPPGGVRFVLGVGFLGAFTTFSTLVGQMYHAFTTDKYAHGLVLPLASVTLGLFALWVGGAVGRTMALA